MNIRNKSLPEASNLDQAEVAKFQRLKNGWWDLEGPHRTLHHINPARLAFIVDNVDLQDKHVLDVGCGGGILTEALARRGGIVTGIDAGFQTVQAAQRHARAADLKINYLTGTAEALAVVQPAVYDVVVCMELLEHVPTPPSLLQACGALLKPGGDAFFSTVNRNLLSWLLVIVGAEYVLRLLPRGTHQYRRFVKPAEIAHWMNRGNLQPLKFMGMRYNPLRCNCRLVADLSVNYLVHARRK